MSNSNAVSCRRVPQLLRCGVMLLLCFLATSALSPVFAESTAVVRSASLALDAAQDVYELTAKVEITLPEEARKGIEAGLALRVVYEIALTRVRGYWPDATVAELEQTYELSYHALSQRYLVRNLNTGEQQDFGSLQAALEQLGDVRGLPVIDADLVRGDSQYEVYLRAVVDLSTTPAALQWLLFWTDDWSATSEWFIWPLRP
jgi:Domain of unknown function (DUF4390)